MKFIHLIYMLFLSHVILGQTGSFSGRVTDARTGEELIGATVKLDETELGGVTGLDGRYTIKDIPTKTYNVTASFVGYQAFTKYNIVVRSEGNIDINFQLEENVESLGEVVVTTNPFRKLEETPLSIQKLSQEEVAAYPGGNNDIAKVVQTLPGVSGSVGGFRNDVIIRGGAPNENVYYLDGVEIPNINHFSTQGSAGGPVGLLNVSFFEGVTLTASSFGAQYDNVLSGVLQFDQRNGNASDYKGNFRLGASESALTVEGPLFKGQKETSNTTLLASARVSYLQFLFDLIGLPFLPTYWDYQYKLNHKIDDHNDIMVTGIGSIDNFAINQIEEFDPEQQAIQDQVPVIQQQTNTIGITWKHRAKDNTGFMQTTLSHNSLSNNFFRYEDNVNETGLYFTNESVEQETKLRYQLTKFSGLWTYSMGGSLQHANYNNQTTDLINSFQYDSDINFLKYGIFAQGSRSYFNERLGTSIGFRVDGNTFTNTGNEFYRTFSPRLAVSYRLDKEGNWTLTGSLGRYYKILPYTVLGFRDQSGQLINKENEYTRSDHAVAGIEYLLNKSSRITVEGFLKSYSNYPVSLTDSISLANKGGGFEVLGNEPVSSDGKGRTYGVEFLFQQKFNGKIYAIAALTIYKSEFTNLNSNEYIPSTWDNGQLISLLGGYKLKNNWEISARYRYLGRAPYPPTDVDATLNNYPAIILDYDRLGTVRLDPFSQLDLRVDKKFSFRKFSLDVYLDIQNVLAQSQPSAPQYGLDRDDMGQIIMPRNLVRVDTNETGTVLPSLGLVVNF
ncbi:MAG: carboxypeptidase-like regulatory domain-containing protein [Bacteroidota bacterium]